MNKIGLVGGLSWISTVEYYRLINEMVRQQLGGYRSARVLLDSLDEQAFLDSQSDDPSEAGCEALMADSVVGLAGADCEVIALCANGLQRFAPAIKERTGVTIVDIAQATARSVASAGLGRVGLLGVRKTMEGALYSEHCSSARHTMRPFRFSRQHSSTARPSSAQRSPPEISRRHPQHIGLGVGSVRLCVDVAPRSAPLNCAVGR